MKTRKLVITDSVSIRRKVHGYVREQILSGEIGPGERLIETKIAQEIGTSRTPVREALHSLEMEGLVEAIPRVGYAVRPVSDKELDEICAIRGAIECLAITWSMEKAPERLIRELRRNIETAEARVAEGAVAPFIDLDGQFHEIIARCSGSTRLLELAQTLRRHMLRYRVQSIYSIDNVLTAIDGHKRILQAAEEGDAQRAVAAVQLHLGESKRDIIRFGFKEKQNGKTRPRPRRAVKPGSGGRYAS